MRMPTSLCISAWRCGQVKERELKYEVQMCYKLIGLKYGGKLTQSLEMNIWRFFDRNIIFNRELKIKTFCVIMSMIDELDSTLGTCSVF